MSLFSKKIISSKKAPPPPAAREKKFFSWRPEYSVYIPSIDEQHKILISLINNFYMAMKKGQGTHVIDDVAKGLIRYIKTHFLEEEKLMKFHGYPDYFKHMEEHDDLSVQVMDYYRDSLESKNSHLTLKLGIFLKEWLTRHILASDIEFGRFLNKNNILNKK